MKLLKFGAQWCGPCRVMERQLADFKDCEVVKYDLDDDEENLKLAAQYGVRNIPVMVLVDDDNKELKRWIGITDVNVIRSEVNSHK